MKLLSSVHNTLRKLWNGYFKFSNKTAKGFFILLFVNIVLLLFWLLPDKRSGSEFLHLQKEFDSIAENFYLNLQKDMFLSGLSRLDRYIIAKYDTIKLFYFDPNTATDEEFRRLGLTDKQIRNIRQYLSRGGKFLVKDDFRKIYSIRTRQYFILKPYIQLPDSLNTGQIPQKTQVFLFEFDPNTASYDDFLKLGFSPKQAKGIINSRKKGWKFYTKKDFAKLYYVSEAQFEKLKPYIKIDRSKLLPELNTAKFYDLNSFLHDEKLTKKILNFRNALGGFYSKEQLSEVYGISPEALQILQDSTTLDVSKIKKIDINTASEKQLSYHPYIKKWQAQKIGELRQNTGYITPQDLKNAKIFKDDELNKLLPYLKFEKNN